MKGICLRYTESEDDAEDILQEAFIRAFKSLKQFDCAQGKLGGWIRTITINVAIENYRKNKTRLKHYSEHSLDQQDHYNDEIIAKLELQELLSIIQKLPDGYRMVFNLYAIEGFTHKEISSTLGISIGTSKSQFSRAKKLLQQMILETNKYEHITTRHAR
ncbi:MAG: RNA polymerase sigma factor [Crocinitomicaceae bacterium]|nr:RNA polymerase sigma factor [Crocinitomicaceae bacterium]